MAARELDAERIRRDEARIDELLSLQKCAMAAEKSVTIINSWSVICCLK